MMDDQYASNKYGELFHKKTFRAQDCIDAYQVEDRLYLGSYENAACMKSGLLALGITHILSIGELEMMPQLFPELITYKMIELEDVEKAKIEKYFPEAISFLKKALSFKNNRVLVHCWAGISRSATIIMAYLIEAGPTGFCESYETVRKARFWVEPNAGFRKKLILFAEECGVEEREKDIENYLKARFLLSKLYASGLTEKEKEKVLQIFRKVFGQYHPFTQDIWLELDISDTV